MKEVRAVLQTRLSEHIILRLGGTDRRQYNLPQLVNLANVPDQLHADARRGHGARSPAGRRRSAGADLEPPAGQLQHRFLRPSERRPQLGARPRHGSGARAAIRRAVGDDDRRHRAQVRRHRREPRLPRQRERPGGHRGNLQRRQRPDERARAGVLRARLRGQVVGDVSAAVRPSRRLGGALPGRPALQPRRHRPRPQSGHRVRTGAAARPDPLHLHVHARYAAREAVAWSEAAGRR